MFIYLHNSLSMHHSWSWGSIATQQPLLLWATLIFFPEPTLGPKISVGELFIYLFIYVAFVLQSRKSSRRLRGRSWTLDPRYFHLWVEKYCGPWFFSNFHTKFPPILIGILGVLCQWLRCVAILFARWSSQMIQTSGEHGGLFHPVSDCESPKFSFHVLKFGLRCKSSRNLNWGLPSFFQMSV